MMWFNGLDVDDDCAVDIDDSVDEDGDIVGD
jgi:hypothetical protein